MIARRKLLLALGASGALAALPAFAQQDKRVRRIGFFTLASAQSNTARRTAFREGMAALNWVEGRDYVLEARFSNGVVSAMPGLAAELVGLKPDVLLTVADESTRLLAERTKTVPIVFAVARDPVGMGLAASLQRPGGNATGLTNLTSELGAKRLQLLKDAFARLARAVVWFEPDNAGSESEAKLIEQAAARLKVRVTAIPLRAVADIEPAFRQGSALGAQGYMVAQGGIAYSRRLEIVDRLRRLKVPAIFTESGWVTAGGLMSYGPSYADNFRRAAGYVDKIFKGARPGDLPIEQPTRFELVLNLKTAKSMGIKFPQAFLARADRVIE